MAASLEHRQIGEQFKILDPARIPERPAGPNRLQINLLGSLAGLVLGFMLVALRELVDSTFRTDEEIAAAFGLPVLAMIPVFGRMPLRIRGRRIAIVLGTGATVCALAALAWVFGMRLHSFGS